MDFVSEFIAPKLVNHKRKRRTGGIIEEMKVVYGVDINCMKVWLVKERPIEMLRGGPTDGYRQMPRYIYIFNSVYPNSHISKP